MKIRLKIIDALSRDIERKFTINELSKFIDEYYSFTYRTVDDLAKEKVLTVNRIGKSRLCSLNLGSEKTLALLQLCEIEKKDDLYRKNKELKMMLEDFAETVSSQKSADAMILFGSYAKNTQRENSDIDVLIIGRTRRVDGIARKFFSKFGREISPVVMTPANFEKQIGKDLIKEIIKDHYVLFGAENYVKMVFRK
jgi:predicted nucleotidyltransferase